MWNYLTTNPQVAASIAAVLSSITALIALGLSTYGIISQRKHNRLSVRPVAYFTIGNYENDIYVKLRNYGTGPLVVGKLTVAAEREYPNLIDATVSKVGPLIWSDFVENIEGRTIPGGEAIVLLRYRPRLENRNDIDDREKLRAALSKVSIQVEYKDIYGKKQDSVSRNLAAFNQQGNP